MTLAVVIPYRADGGERDRNLAWTAIRLIDQVPGAPFVIGACNPDAPFNRAEAILDGAAKTDADVLVISDGDVWCPGLPAAVEAVRDGAPWAVPHLKLYRLNEPSTLNVIGNDEEPTTSMRTVERPYNGHEAGTLLVIRSEVLEDVPPDVRFRAWGQEDDAWAAALRTLVAPSWRGTAPCFHLFHQPQPRMSRSTGSMGNRTLWRRYAHARRKPAAMRALIDEAKEAMRCQSVIS